MISKGQTNKFVSTVLITTLIVAFISLGGFVAVVYAAPSSSLYVEGGIYPASPTFTIWKEGSTYYAKNAYGLIPAWGESSNATLIIQTAIDNAGTGGVYLTAATYYLRGVGSEPNKFGLTLPSGSKLYGEGEGTILTQQTNENINILITSEGPKGARNDITICDLTINANYQNQDYSGSGSGDYLGSGISTYGNGWVIKNVNIKDVGQYGGIVVHGALNRINNIDIDNVWNNTKASGRERFCGGIMLTSTNAYGSTLNNIIISNATGGAIHLEDYANDNVITGLYADTCGWAGVLLEYAENNTVSVFSLNDCERGIRLEYVSINNVFSSGTIRNSIEESISATSDHNTYSDIQIWNSTEEGIYLNSVQYSQFSNIKISYSQQEGIELVGSQNNTFTSLTLLNNGQATNNTYADIAMTFTSPNNTFIGVSSYSLTSNRVTNGYEETASNSGYNVVIGSKFMGAVTMGINSQATSKINLCWNGTTWIS